MTEQQATNQRLIAEFQKNNTEKVRVSLQEWKTQTYLDFRVFFQDDKGSWLPTKKGITISVGLLGDLRAAIDKAIATVEMEGPGPSDTPADDADSGQNGEIPF